MKKIISSLVFIIVATNLLFAQPIGFPISNKATGGSIGAAVATVDTKTTFNVNQSTAGQTLIVPNLTAVASGKIIYIDNVGSVDFTLVPGGLVGYGTGVMLRWTGAAWSVTGKGYSVSSAADSTVFATKYYVNAGLSGKQNAFTSQSQNTFYAGPSSGSGSPSFRVIVPADIPALNQNTTGNAATVTTIPALSGDVSNTGNAITVSGSVVKNVVLNTPSVVYTSPITFSTSSSTATGTLSLNTQTANSVFVGPTTGGAATPTFRALVASDIPTLPNTQISGLGTAATKNVGTTTGTVAAGDDSRMKGYQITCYTPAFSPADGVTYYFGAFPSLSAINILASTARQQSFYGSGTVTKATIFIYCSTTDGSTEAVTFSLRINDATDHLITNSMTFNGTPKRVDITGLSIPFTDLQKYVIKMVSPTWVTNPLNAFVQINLYCE
jgi:hypothetical protein